MEYNGWKNYETWNVALWIGNNERIYAMAKQAGNWENFQDEIRSFRQQTPDGVSYNDPALDTERLDEMIKEL